MSENHDSIPADGNLYRCFCGVPIFFTPAEPPANNGTYYSYNPCWRTTDGCTHTCAEFADKRPE